MKVTHSVRDKYQHQDDDNNNNDKIQKSCTHNYSSDIPKSIIDVKCAGSYFLSFFIL